MTITERAALVTELTELRVIIGKLTSRELDRFAELKLIAIFADIDPSEYGADHYTNVWD